MAPTASTMSTLPVLPTWPGSSSIFGAAANVLNIPDYQRGFSNTLTTPNPSSYNEPRSYFSRPESASTNLGRVGINSQAASAAQGGLSSQLSSKPLGSQAQSDVSNALLKQGYQTSGRSGYSGADAQLASWAKAGGFSDADLPMALAIIKAESRGKPGAINSKNSNGSVDTGLFQVNSIHRNGAARGLNLLDPVQNSTAAHRVFADAGNKWTPWTTFKNQAYKEFYVPSVPVTKSSYTTASSTGGVRQSITSTAYAVSLNHIPYAWGGNSLTKGVDCSGLVQQVYKKFGFNLPRTANEQAHYGARMPVNNLQPGDLVAFYNNRKGEAFDFVGHIAIYMGNNQIAEAPTFGQDVKISTLNSTRLRYAYGVHLQNVI